jgi:DNA-binding transcriptional LysR family regulator
MHTEAPRVRWPFSHDGREHEVVVEPALITNDAQVLLQATLAGRGIAVLADYLVNDALTDGRLVELLPDHALPEVPISVLFPSARHLKRSAREWIQLIARVLE